MWILYKHLTVTEYLKSDDRCRLVRHVTSVKEIVKYRNWSNRHWRPSCYEHQTAHAHCGLRDATVRSTLRPPARSWLRRRLKKKWWEAANPKTGLIHLRLATIFLRTRFVTSLFCPHLPQRKNNLENHARLPAVGSPWCDLQLRRADNVTHGAPAAARCDVLFFSPFWEWCYERSVGCCFLHADQSNIACVYPSVGCF